MTASGTPPSPVSSIMVHYRGAAAPMAPGSNGMSTEGQCMVVLQAQAGRAGKADPVGESLVTSLQEAVQSGSISARHAASVIVQHIRAGEQEQQGRVDAGGGQSLGHAAPQRPAHGQQGAPGLGSGLFDGWSIDPTAALPRAPPPFGGGPESHMPLHGGGGQYHGQYHAGNAFGGAVGGGGPEKVVTRPPPGFAGALKEQETRSVFLGGGYGMH